MTQKAMTNDEAVIGSTIFFAIFGTFGRYVTNPRGTFVENVKKVQNQPTLMGIGQPGPMVLPQIIAEVSSI
jgi:phage gpG-like protein